MLKYIVICAFIFKFAASRGGLEKYGPFEILLYSDLLKCNHNNGSYKDVSDIGIHFYNDEDEQEVTYAIRDAARNILQEDLNHRKTWNIYVPGFNSPITGNGCKTVRDAFKNLENSYLIIVDHFLYTNVDGSYRKSFEKAVEHVNSIAESIARFLADINRKVPVKSIRLIGHSLGSQILGKVGFQFKHLTGVSLHRITGLDPAGPCFSHSLVEEQLRSGAADYVEVFHCNSGGFGTSSVLGDVDFFANDKGEWQPGCKVPLVPGLHDSEKAAQCSHQKCVEIYAKTVRHRDLYVARKCDSYKKFKRDECFGDAIAGYWGKGDARGVFYFRSDVEDY